ncbi:C4-dicarboxylate transporter DctA [Pseudochryseolinea flava]|uniref:Glutamate/aspartate:proton symporter GltP n=1 Tax=Pseudochryseolinea flava TaxID=2059302 RepID=A0A364YAZ6_9BACT|nr:C4-dicarboxylate transporter DctA [Pseudochryseolinea flava]RAW03515.1 glutamate/aspartate:proton symporter GltP [Pseudochryseolinea flava]
MKYIKIPYIQVIVAIAVGILVGFLFPAFTPTAKLLSDTFINLIKMIIAPIIFATVTLGIAGVGDMKKVGRIGGKGILYFEIVSTIALVIGLFVANLMRPGAGIAHDNLDTSAVEGYAKSAKQLNWGEFFAHIIPSNIFKAFAEGDILQVLFFSILFGAALTQLGDVGRKVQLGVEKISIVLFKMMAMIMKVAPIGAFAGMAYTIGKFGFAALVPLGKLMLCVYATMALFVFVILNAILAYYKLSLWKLLVYVKDELLLVLGTSSSESALPSIMEKLESAGIRKNVVGLIIPTGYSFNLDGTAIYLSMAFIFLAQVFEVPLSLVDQLTIIAILMLTSKGAAAVTGGGFIVLASTLAIWPSIPMSGLALLIGIDRFMSEARSITNLIGNTVATVVIARSENEIDMTVYRNVVE